MSDRRIQEVIGQIDLAARQERLTGPQLAQKTHATRFPSSAELPQLYLVMEAGQGPGLYDCVPWYFLEQYWVYGTGGEGEEGGRTGGQTGASRVEVLNMYEEVIGEGHTPALALWDLLLTYKIQDYTGVKRRIGIPMTPPIRLARANEDAPASDHITCTLYDRTGGLPGPGYLGYGIEVYGNVCNGTNLDVAAPYIRNGENVNVYHQKGRWYLATNLNKFKGWPY